MLVVSFLTKLAKLSSRVIRVVYQIAKGLLTDGPSPLSSTGLENRQEKDYYLPSLNVYY